MSSCKCLLCGPCKAKAKSAAHHGQPVKKPITLLPAPEPTALVGRTDAVIVWVLGQIETTPGNFKKELQAFSTMNGYHIRTIPGNRWNNPVLVGAGGNGFVVIVDRYTNCDVLRVTDEYAGANIDDFDDTGLPIPEANFTSLTDLQQITTPINTRCTGLKVLPSGLLLAALSYIIPQATPLPTTYLKVDLKTLIDGKQTGISLNGTIALSTDMGLPIGSPCMYDLTATKGGHTFTAAASGVFGNVAFIADYTTGKVLSWVGLPDNPPIIGIAQTQGTISVLMGAGGIGKYIVRFRIADRSNLMSGTHSDKVVSSPALYPVWHTFQAQDGHLKDQNPTDQSIKDYLNVASAIVGSDSILTTEVINAISKGEDTGVPWYTSFDTMFESTAINDGRFTQSAVMLTGYYGSRKIKIPAQVILIDPDLDLIGLESEYATLTELYARKANGSIDSQQIIFRNLHGTHYDWLSEGGWQYGCTQQSGTKVVATNSLIPLSHSSSRSPMPGTVATLPDLKVALVDSLNGLAIYHNSKPIGYNIWGGAYAVPQLITNSGIAETVCGTEANTVATELDGMNRHDMSPVILTPADETHFATYVAAWHDFPDYDLPWGFFTRRVSGPTTAYFNVGSETWSIRDGDGDLIPDYQGLISPVKVTKNGTKGQFLYPPLTPWTPGVINVSPSTIPVFNADADAGFFSLKMPVIKTTYYNQTSEKLAIAQDALNATITALSAAEGQLASDFAVLVVLGLDDISDSCGNLPDSSGNVVKTGSQADNTQTVVIGGPNDAGVSSGQSAQLAVSADKKAIAALTARVSSEEVYVNNLTVLLNQLDPVTSGTVYEVPQAIENLTYGPMVRSAAQSLDPTTGGHIEVPTENSSIDLTVNTANTVITPTPGSTIPTLASDSLTLPAKGRLINVPAPPGIVPAGTLPWQSVPAAGGGLRAIVIEPNIRSWINLNIDLSRVIGQGSGADGQGVWLQPETRRGLFGLKLHRTDATVIINYFDALTATGIYPFCGGIIPGYVYDAGDVAADGAVGVWEIDIKINGKSAPGSFNQVTDPDVIANLAPTDLQETLGGTVINGVMDDPDTGIYQGGFVFYGPDLVQRVDVKVRLVNYAFTVYRVGIRTKEYIVTNSDGTMAGYRPNSGPEPPGGASLGRYGADPGFFWGEDCDAFCFGNVPCDVFLFGNSKLCRDDQDNPLVKNILWEGNASYVWDADPYATRGLSMGRYISPSFQFDLSSGMFQYDINLRTGEGRTGLGSCDSS